MKFSVHLFKPFYLIAVVLLVMMARGLPLWLLIPLLVLALAAPLIRELHPKTDLDERQIALSHWSSHLAFYLLIGLLLFVILTEYLATGKNPDPEWYMLLIVPLVVKLIISLFQNYGTLPAARYIAYFFAAIFILFVLLSHGFTLESLIGFSPFILILIASAIIPKSPRIAGVVYLLLAVGLSFFFRGWLRLDVYTRLIMYSLIPLPLLISGVALVIHKSEVKS